MKIGSQVEERSASIPTKGRAAIQTQTLLDISGTL